MSIVSEPKAKPAPKKEKLQPAHKGNLNGAPQRTAIQYHTPDSQMKPVPGSLESFNLSHTIQQYVGRSPGNTTSGRVSVSHKGSPVSNELALSSVTGLITTDAIVQENRRNEAFMVESEEILLARQALEERRARQEMARPYPSERILAHRVRVKDNSGKNRGIWRTAFVPPGEFESNLAPLPKSFFTYESKALVRAEKKIKKSQEPYITRRFNAKKQITQGKAFLEKQVKKRKAEKRIKS